MTKNRAVVLAIVAIVLLLAAMYLRGPSSVPPGQEPLVALSNANFSDFENAFDRDSDASRLVLLLSPT
jgi:hypothetical protein